MATKITGLTALNVRAIREVFPLYVQDGEITTTASTATFNMPAAEAAGLVAQAISRLPGRSHPKASLHAVSRKLARAAA